jgi:hypothetical protein
MRADSVPVAGGPNLTDKVYTVLEAFARVMAESFFILPAEWTDFSDGWRRRFANATASAAVAWGLDSQVNVAAQELVATGLLRSGTEASDGLMSYRPLHFASDFLQALRATTRKWSSPWRTSSRSLARKLFVTASTYRLSSKLVLPLAFGPTTSVMSGCNSNPARSYERKFVNSKPSTLMHPLYLTAGIKKPALTSWRFAGAPAPTVRGKTISAGAAMGVWAAVTRRSATRLVESGGVVEARRTHLDGYFLGQ